MIIHSPIISGSLTFADGATFTLPDNGVYSGSFSGSINGIGDPETFSASIASDFSALSTDYNDLQNVPAGIVSGSSQIVPLLPTGVVSGSSQISADQTDGWADDFKVQLDSNTVISSSAQVVNIANSQIQNTTVTFNGTQVALGDSGTIANLVSGSSQVLDILSSLNSYTASNDTTNTSQDARLTSLESATASLQGTDIIVSLSGDVSGSGTITNLTDVTISTTIQANSVALGTDTTGNYVATLGSGTGVTIGSNTGEGSTPTIAVNYGSTANTAVQGNTTITLNGTSNEIDVTGTAAQALGGGPSYTIGLADSISGDRTFSNNVTITGNLTVNGTTTSVNSNTVNIGDNILVLNSDETGTPSQNGGIEIERGTSTNASLIWDETADSWKAGLAAAEVELVTISGTQTLTNKTINGSQLVNGSVANGKLENSTISGVSLGSNLNALTIGTGLSGTSYNGSSAVTITNTGVTSITGTSNQVVASASTGGVTLSLPQSIATNSTVQFGKLGVGGASDATYELKVTGDIGATGDIVAYVSSDKRLKDNIKNIENPIEKVQALNGVTWDWNELASEAAKQSPNVGVIAQEVEEVLPQLVHDRENGFKGVDYAKLTGLLIEAIKEQQKQIEELKSKLG